jgi:hypothetical protein
LKVSAIIRPQWTAARAALAGAILFALAALGRGASAPAGGESFTGTAADLQHIVGHPVEIHATPVIAQDPMLPLICRTIVNGFRDAAADPETHQWLGYLVHVVVIEGWSSGKQTGHVDLKEKVLTIQTMTGEAEINNLRLLVAETLKKVAHLKAKQGTAK